MCGIVGFCFKDGARRADPEIIRRMCRAIVHRGPDDEGMHTAGNFAMGMRRLAVVDLVSGHQPIFNEAGDVGVVFNGEIFNYPELFSELSADGHRFATRSDTEVLVHGYEKWGDGLPERLNGMFAFSLWDARNRRVLLARDHVGIKPLYLFESPELVAWASEIKALFAVPGARPEIDDESLLDYLTFGYVPAPRTLFRGVRKVPPATLVTVQDGLVREKTFWDLRFCTEERPAEEWDEQLRWLIDDAVRRQLMSDVPLGAFLSGGLDSSSIVATMSRLGVSRISTYAIGFGAEDAFHSELAKASAVARLFGTDHHEIVVEPDVASLLAPLIRHLDEPVTDTSFLVTYLVSRLARETVTVILSGVGGDEVFAGYRRYLGPKLHGAIDRLPPMLVKGVLLPLARKLPVDRGSRVRSWFRYARGFLEHAGDPPGQRYQGYVEIFGDRDALDVLTEPYVELRRARASDHVAAAYDRADSPDALNRMLYADLKSSLVDSLLSFTDKMSMAVSLEARVPLLDTRILELGARMPVEHKLNGLRGLKHPLKRAMADRLPPQVLEQRKQGFGTPISRWFRGSLRPLLDDLLSAERLKRRGIFRPAAVARLIDDHMTQRADRSEHLLALLTFEVWCEEFLEKGGWLPCPL